MLLQIEKILSHDNLTPEMSECDIFQSVRRELAEKIADKMITEDLIKIEINRQWQLDDDLSLGVLTKVRATVRAYHPDA